MGEQGRVPVPRCKAILICDDIIVDAVTGKVSIIGIIDQFVRFPNGYISPFKAYANLVQGIGPYNITVEIHDLRDIQNESVVARSPVTEITFADRSDKHAVIIPVPPLRLNDEGEYDVVLCANGEELDRQTFTAQNMPQGPPGGQPNA